ncbi:MAG: NYN domain-containing protein [Desulfosarcinaceae bacterium]|nr:NYN domain-containing protein [Desulfosarcinaceae bacterium]
MGLHLIIDGYNLIRQSDWLGDIDRRSLQRGREALLTALIRYQQLRGHRITVVFDGGRAPGFGDQRDRQGGVEIRFSRPGELADAVIKRLCVRERGQVLVVTSDAAIIRYAEARGVATIGSPAFEEKLKMAQYLAENGVAEERIERGWSPTTRKKGPARRRSKRQRRNRLKTRKL